MTEVPAIVELAMRRVIVGLPLRAMTRLTVTGREHVPRSGAALIASNHLAFADSIVLPIAADRRVRFVAKAEYFTGTGPGGAAARAWYSAFGAIPLDRDNPRSAVQSLQLAEDVLAAGEAFGIYPEGTRSRDGRLHKGRTGVARIALASGAPLIPCALVGTDRLQPPDGSRIRPARVSVSFGEPIDVAGLSQRYAKAALLRVITDAVTDSIARMGGQERSGQFAGTEHGEGPHS